ncbi:MAG: dephospho-CoA kinase [Colwellia sp.]|nr:dephospho-CoA kinase [Colwellia sp.]
MTSFIVGLTGGIGSGKTTVANMFAQLGIDIIDADIVARQVVEPNTTALRSIIEHFGDDYLDSSGQLNRSLLRTRIFSNSEDKIWLNQLLHPIIRNKILEDIESSSSPYCLLVAPLLLENKLDNIVDRVLVIDITENEQIIRSLKRDTSSEIEIKSIIASQISRSDRLNAADDVIDNSNFDLSFTIKQVKYLDSLYHQYVQLK